jgi:hypothetical protein
MRVHVQLLGAEEELSHSAAVNTRVEEGFFVVTEQFSDSTSKTTRYPVTRIAWVKEESD